MSDVYKHIDEQFSTIDIALIFDEDRACIRGWTETPNFFKPSIRKSMGRGYKALYSREDLYAFALFRYLVRVERKDRKEASMLVCSIRSLLKCGSEENKDSPFSWDNAIYARLMRGGLDEKGGPAYSVGIYGNTDNPKYKMNKVFNFSYPGDDPYKSGFKDGNKWTSGLIINLENIRKATNKRIETFLLR